MARGKYWSPVKYSSDTIARTLESMLAEGVNNQRTLTKYSGDPEGFHQYVADKSWDPWTFKLIGENTGYILALLDFANELDLKLPPQVVLPAEMHTYQS